jgi:hypothetical protein
VLHANIEPGLPKRGLNGIMRSTIAACAVLVLLMGTVDAEQCPPGALGVSRTLVVDPNGAVSWPLAARAQQAMPLVACLGSES